MSVTVIVLAVFLVFFFFRTIRLEERNHELMQTIEHLTNRKRKSEAEDRARNSV
jgi:hypothetical protein